MKNFAHKLLEALIAVLPITALVIILNFAMGDPMPTLQLGSFLVGFVCLILGEALYTLGSSISLEPIGEHIGAKVTGTKKVPLILGVCFVVGVIVTVAEPDLTVLATQISSIPNPVLIWSVGLGVGLFMVAAVLRLLLKIKLNVLLIAMYAVVFIIAAFSAADYVPLAFDSGGVTTGPITVPFILALGAGVSTVMGGKNSQEDSFGMVGICSVGPIIAVLILGLVYNVSPEAGGETIAEYADFGDVMMHFVREMPTYLEEVGIALLPIYGFFIIFQFALIRFPLKRLIRIGVGAIYTYIGLTIFLLGVNVGFMPAGTYIGGLFTGELKWLLLPIGALIGSVLVLAEPAVHVLNKQVESVTGGSIKRKNMLIVLAIAMSVAVTLSMLRVVTGISIWWILLPVYVVSLGLSFFVPKIFTAIAFDSGGVASGPMTATFLLPFAMGASEALGGNILTDAFGTVAFVAMTPLLAVQIMGLVFKVKRHIAARTAKAQEYRAMLEKEGEIIVLED